MTGKWNVGDEILVEESRWRGPQPIVAYTVTRVARKYFYGQEVDRKRSHETAFDISTGWEKGNGTYHARAYTPADWETEQRRRELSKRMRAHRVDLGLFGYGGERLTPEALEAILTILDREKTRIEGNK